MKQFIAITAVLFLTACSISDVIPSFWDDNQSMKIIDIYIKTIEFDCDKEHLSQISAIRADLKWFQLYSESKGFLQNDVLKVIFPLQETVDSFYNRSKVNQGSKTYCETKKIIMITQAKKSAEAVMMRF